MLDYAGFVRKFEHFLLLPSVFPVHNRLSFFTVQRVFNGYTIGLPCWFYRWGIRDKSVKEFGYFGLWHPKAVFGHYPTKFVAGSDGGISDALSETSKKAGYVGTRSQQRKTSVDWGVGELGLAGGEDFENTLDDFQHSTDQLLQDMEQTARRAAKRIGR